MKRTIESRIQANAIFIYCILALVCCGMIFYIYTFRNSIDIQKENIKHNNQVLTLTNELIYLVQQSQTTTNLYLTSKDKQYLVLFEDLSFKIKSCIDSLFILSGSKQSNDELLEINQLLEDKRLVISKLHEQFTKQNPFDTINQKLQNYNPESVLKDTFFLITTPHDTIIKYPSKKTFWARLVQLFAPHKNIDTVTTITILKSDTIKVKLNDSIHVLYDIQHVSKEASKYYSTQMDKIKQQVDDLIVGEQEISMQIYVLLIKLYHETLYSIMNEIEKSDQILTRNYQYLLIGGILSLILVLILIIMIIHDVNKSKIARKALEEANIITKRLMENRHKLLLAISHDIKAPLASILSYLNLWQQDTEKSKELQGLSSMQNSGKYIISLLENLLEFSSLEQGKQEVIPVNFQVQELCNEIAEMFSPLALQRNISFNYESHIDDQLFICSDRIKIKQIITNLLSNSVKYIIEGNITFHIVYQNERLCFTVEDTGVGIPQDEINSLFKPFSRIDKHSYLAKGSGLGLYVVKGLTDLLQGEITIHSEVGKGTQIKVIIPAKQILDIDKETLFPKNAIALPSHKKYNMLIVDDDISLLTVLKEMLFTIGHHATVCATMTEFDKYISNLSEFDIVLTDMEMGAYSGIDILKKVRHTAIPIPVIIMTAQSEYNRTKADKEGFDAYLSKPFTLNALLELFGSSAQAKTKLSAKDQNYNLTSLLEMFDEDKEVINKILTTFIQATVANIEHLKKTLEEKDIMTAQYLCHKMLPMFTQLGASMVTEILNKMDASRGKTVEEYPQWKDDTMEIIRLSKELIVEIRQSINKNE
ncbi:MAG: response regulator [Bacteroidales bacterium]|jgi:signal transduction histidine kinase/FixJ family two-component response regulator|nr:response regulator [Bacteroidales bacterium]